MLIVVGFTSLVMTNAYAARGMKLEDHDAQVRTDIETHDGDMTTEHDALSSEHDTLIGDHVFLDGKLNQIISDIGRIGVCPEPGACPGAVPKTGSTINVSAGEDGNLQKGVEWPDSRLTDNADGTITDNLTCLIWDKQAIRVGLQNWLYALAFCNGLAANGAGNGLYDSSVAGDWRLPNVRELFSLIDFSQHTGNDMLPPGHTFQNVSSSGAYWTSTSRARVPDTFAWTVAMNDDSRVVSNQDKDGIGHVWCVRGGP